MKAQVHITLWGKPRQAEKSVPLGDFIATFPNEGAAKENFEAIKKDIIEGTVRFFGDILGVFPVVAPEGWDGFKTPKGAIPLKVTTIKIVKEGEEGFKNK